MYQNIVNPRFEISFPDLVSTPAVGVIRSLLRSKCMQRLGCKSGGAADVRLHPFFETDGFEIDKLISFEIPPPYTPTITDDAQRNFDKVEGGTEFFGQPPYDYYDQTQWDYTF